MRPVGLAGVISTGAPSILTCQPGNHAIGISAVPAVLTWSRPDHDTGVLLDCAMIASPPITRSGLGSYAGQICIQRGTYSDAVVTSIPRAAICCGPQRARSTWRNCLGCRCGRLGTISKA